MDYFDKMSEREARNFFAYMDYDYIPNLTVEELNKAFAAGASAQEEWTTRSNGRGTALSRFINAKPDVIIEMLKHGADISTDWSNYNIRTDEERRLIQFDRGLLTKPLSKNPEVPTFLLAFHRPNLMKALIEEKPTDVLRAAIQYRKTEWIRPAIEAKADVNATIKIQDTEQPLITYAARESDSQTLKYLMDAGATMPTGKDSPLLSAWQNGNAETMQFLTRKGLDYKALLPDMFNVLVADIRTGIHNKKYMDSLKAKLQFAIDQGVDITQGDDLLLQEAIYQNFPEIVETLIKNKSDTILINGKPAVLRAIQDKHPEIVKTLLEHGENPNLVFDGKSMLEWAQEHSYTKDEKTVIQVLEEHGAVEVPTTDFSGLTDKRRTELFRDEMGEAKYNIFKLEALLKNGITNPDDFLDSAIDKSNPDILELLLKNKVDPNGVAKKSKASSNAEEKVPPLVCAIKRRKFKSVEMLLKYGANPNMLFNGESILEIAHAESHGYSEDKEMIKLLEEKGAKMYPSLDFKSLSEERRSELFCKECRKEKYSEEKLLALIDQGIDIHYRIRGTGGQRMDDGQNWTWISRLFKRGMAPNNPKVIQALLDQPSVESELRGGHQCCHWGYNNAAWLYDIFDNLYNMRSEEYDKVLPVILASPKMTDTGLLEKGFKYLPQEVAEKLLRDETLDPKKLNALLQAKTFTIKDKSDLDLLPKLKRAKSICLGMDTLSPQEIDTVLTELMSSSSLDSVELTGLKRVKKSQEKETREKLAAQVKDALYPKRTLLEKAMGKHKPDSQKAKGLLAQFHKEESDAPRRTTLKLEEKASVVQFDRERDLIKKLALLPVDNFSATDVSGKEIKITPLIVKARQDMEAAKHAGLQPWQVEIYKYLSTKDYRKAASVMEKQGLFKAKKEGSLDVWGSKEFQIQRDLIGLEMQDVGNGTIAIGQIYNNDVFVGSGVGWKWTASVALVNLDKGVGPQSATNGLMVRDPMYETRDIYDNIPRSDFLTVDGDRASVSMAWYDSASVQIPDMDTKTKKKTMQPRGNTRG